jgi:tetratricopeptide (TPR) repeat protein
MRKWVVAIAVLGGLSVCGGGALLALKLGQKLYHLRASVSSASVSSASVAAARKPVESHPLPLPAVASELVFVGEEGTDATGYPKKTVSVLCMHSLLRNRRFEELTRYVDGIQREFESDFRKEYWPTDALSAFGALDPAFEALLDEWVAQHPNSFAPYAARGNYRSSLASHYRGGEFIAKTPPAQLAAMNAELDRAQQDYERALMLEPDALDPHLGLISDGKHRGRAQQAFERAVTRFPLSFRLYFAAMSARTPRWGGSYAIMSAIADRAQRDTSRNPRLEILPGVVELARAEDLTTAKDYQGALAAAIRAQSFGENWTFFAERGEAQAHLGDFKSAVAEYDRALALRSELGGVLRKRAHALFKLQEFERAGESFAKALQINPTEGLENRATYAGGLEFAGNKHFNAGRAREALAAYDLALFIQPDRAETRRWRDELLRRGNPNLDPDELERLTRRAQKEDGFEAYLALDGALAKRGRFAEIIEHWTEHLARHPEDGRGYLERGGAYRAIRQMDAAIRDAERACELGVVRGCEYAKKFASAK